MKRIISIFAVLLGLVWLASLASATNRFGLNASNIVSGQLDPLRVNLSSFTMQGNTVQLINGTVVFGDGSIQNTAAGSSVWATNGTHIYPTNTGNVGVGTQNPTGRLDVRGPFVTTGTVNLAGSNGNVGIGTLSTGSSLLDIFGGSVTIRGSGAALSVNGTGLVVQNGGNVGMGTVSPSSLLDLSGGSMTIRGSGAGLSVNGNTGIGTNQPSSILDISGGSLTIRGSNAGLSVAGAASIAPAAGSAGPQFVVSTGTSRLFEVNGTSIVMNVPLYGVAQATFSEVWVQTANGYGGTNTAIKRWASIIRNIGSDITLTQNSTNGDSFTINKTGMYAIGYSAQFSAGAVNMGVSVNSNQLTTQIQNVTAASRVLNTISAASNTPGNVSGVVYLNAGDVVRAHDDPGSAGTQTQADWFRITKVSQ